MVYLVKQGSKTKRCEFMGTSETERGTMLRMRPVSGGKTFLAYPNEVSLDSQRTQNGTKGQDMNRRSNPYGELKDGTPVFYVREYQPYEIKRNEQGEIIGTQNTGDILSELTDKSIAWMGPMYGFVVFSDLNKSVLSDATFKQLEKLVTSTAYERARGYERVHMVKELIGDKVKDYLKKAKKDAGLDAKAWNALDKVEKADFYKEMLGKGFAGFNTNEAMSYLSFEIDLRNKAFFNGRLGTFLREHPEVIEAVAQGRRLDSSVVEDIALHAKKLGYANVIIKKNAKGKMSISLGDARLQEMDRDIRGIVPYIQPQGKPKKGKRSTNPYASFMAPRSAVDGGTQHRERGYVDYAANTYTPLAGSRYFGPINEPQKLMKTKDSSSLLMKAAALLAFAEPSMGLGERDYANRLFFGYVSRKKMTETEFVDFVAYLSTHGKGTIQPDARSVAQATWDTLEGPFLIVQEARAKAERAKRIPTPKAQKAAKKVEEKAEKLEEKQEELEEAVAEVEEAVAVVEEKKAKTKKATGKKKQQAKQEEKKAEEKVKKAKKKVEKKAEQVEAAVEEVQEAVEVVEEAVIEAVSTSPTYDAAADEALAAAIAPKPKKGKKGTSVKTKPVVVEVVQEERAPLSAQEKMDAAMKQGLGAMDSALDDIFDDSPSPIRTTPSTGRSKSEVERQAEKKFDDLLESFNL